MINQTIDYKSVIREKNRQRAAFRRFITWESPGDEIKRHLGVEIGTLREWIESKFIDGMTWGNYGSLWVIDHIVPMRMFDVFSESELKICWHYKNLMPLLKEDNLKKEGNVFFSYELLKGLKDKDYFYMKLFERIEPEFHWMSEYLKNYSK